ncbi:unnamed protein product [Penicillium manginii]
MKSFTIAAILASTAMALPTNIIPSGTAPSGVPSCIPSGVIPSGVPIPSGIPMCTGAPSATPSATPSGIASNNVNSVMTVTNEQSKNILVQLTPTVANLLTGLNLPLSEPVGNIVQTASSVDGLNLQGLGSGFMTVVTQEGSVALVKLTSTVEGLFSGLGLPEVGSLVGSLVGTLENLVPTGMKRDATSSVTDTVMHITDLNGDILPVALGSNVLGLLSGLDLSSVQGPIGSVVAMVPSVSDLPSKAMSMAADPTQLVGVLGQDGTSAMLVKLEGTATGLLGSLGLTSLLSPIGSVTSVTGLFPA